MRAPRRTIARIALASAASALLATGLAVAGPVWARLGERHVDDRVDHDVIHVGAGEGRFDAIKLKVAGPAVHMLDMKVYFGNGGVQDVEVRRVLPRNGETRVIDLKGDDRVIDRVEFWYEAETLRRGKGSNVVLFGRH